LIFQITSYVKHIGKLTSLKKANNALLHKFASNVMDERKKYYAFAALELIRSRNELNNSEIFVTDLGAGSKTLKSNQRKVSDIAKKSLKKSKFAEMLFRLVQNYNCNQVLELGTSLGITTAYLAKANKSGVVTTIEGCSEISKLARQNLKDLDCGNVDVITGDFDTVLPSLLPKMNPIDLLFIDGNHSEDATLRYFELCKPYLSDSAIVVLDDIHWSRGMHSAWEKALKNEKVGMSIDVFEMGILFMYGSKTKTYHLN
jgi:predicted O-methyltransferase YrrM